MSGRHRATLVRAYLRFLLNAKQIFNPIFRNLPKENVFVVFVSVFICLESVHCLKTVSIRCDACLSGALIPETLPSPHQSKHTLAEFQITDLR